MAKRERLQKTNAMRELERGGIAFEALEYAVEDDNVASGYGVHVAELLGEDPDSAFKTCLAALYSASCCLPHARTPFLFIASL